MAVTPDTMVELADLAKDYFTNIWQSQINTDTPLFNQLGKLERGTFTGKKMIFGVKLANGGGSANAGANKTLPAAQVGVYDQGEQTLARTYTRLALDGLAIEATKKQEGSFRPALAETMEDRLTAHSLERNRQLFCNADGKLALIASTAASATQTVGSDYGVAGGGNGTRHINPGDFLQLNDVANANIGGRTVVSVDPAASTVVLSSTITSTATTNYFTRATADTDNFTAGEASGLLKAISGSTATFEAIPGTGRWKSAEDTNSGTARPITDPLVMKMIAKIRAESRMTPSAAITRPDITLKYSEVFLPLRRIDGQDKPLKAGYIPTTSITHAGGQIPIIEDLDSPDGRVFFLNFSSVKVLDLVGSTWSDMDGIQFIRVGDKDAIEGYIRSYHNLCWVQRNCNGVISDLETIPSIDRLGTAA